MHSPSVSGSPSAGPPPDALASDASLHLIVDDVLDHLVADQLPPCLLHLGRPGADGVVLGIKPLDGTHPSLLLTGFDAPGDWHALGIATRGWAYPLDQRQRADRNRTRVCVVTMVSRTGEVAHRTWVEPDGGVDRSTRDAMSTEAPGGEQMDLLRRALGLSTDEPPCSSQVYWSTLWLAGVIDLATTSIPTWDAVVAVHPAMVLYAGTPPDIGVSPAQAFDLDLVADFIPIVESFARVCDWRRLRRLVSERRLSVPDMDASAAPWFDDGSFARYVLNRCPPLDALRQRARHVLDADLASKLDRTLDGLGVPERAWPDSFPADRPAADRAGTDDAG